MGPGMGIESAQRTGNQSFLESFSFARPKVLVVGCGGAGGNSVHRLHRMGIHGARTVVVNTDAVHLDSIQADRKLLIGAGVTRGMGAGGRPEIGERCAEISETELRNRIGDVIKGITESITVPSLINLDFSDVRTILQSGGTSTVFYGENAEDDTRRVVSDTLNNPLLEVDYRGANGALIHISAGPGLRLRTAHEVVEGLTAAMRPDANVIFGVRVDPKYNGILRVLAIMTGVRSPMVESVRESVSVADVVSDRSDPLAKDFPRPDRRR